jgi:chromatin remodeling complex protein RSC6
MASTEVPVDVKVDSISSVAERFSAILSAVDEHSKLFSGFMKAINSDIKSLQKEFGKTTSKRSKKVKKEEVPDSEKRKNVFDIPVPVSDELCTFLGLEKGQMYSRQFITNSLRDYVKEHGLQNPENKRYIVLDSAPAGQKLNELLKPDQPLTFFNMQRYLKPHYPKSDSTSDVSVEPKKTPKRSPKKSVEEPVPEVVKDEAVVPEAPVEEEPKKKTRRVGRGKA